MASPTRGSVFADGTRGVGATWARWSATTRAAFVVLIILYLVALLAPVIAPFAQSQQLDIVALKDRPPSVAHLFGTDRFSRDVLSRVLYGTRVSLTIATLAMVVSALIGTAYGLVAGAFGGFVDAVLMRLLDAMLAIPRVLLLIAVLALWNPVPLWGLVVLLGVTGWFEVSRLVRAEALTLRERDFVLAARSLGAGRGRIIVKHLLPNVLTPVVVATTLGIGNVIALETALSYIGIGVREPSASLGTMFQSGTEAFVGTWWAAVFPGAVIVLTILCFNILGDALRAALDPRQVHNVGTGMRSATKTEILNSLATRPG
jgi:peptide/nickel transport system permease protein